jgi:probable HAF family extracellular repeat protein
MILPSFARRWMYGKAFASQRTKQMAARPAQRRVHLRLEALEDRSLPSGYNITTLDPPGSTETHAVGVNNAGQVVGSYLDKTGSAHGYLFSSSGYTTLDVPGFPSTELTGINDSGQIVGNYYDTHVGGGHGFLLSGGTYTTLDVPGSGYTTAEGINASGQIVGWYDNATGSHGFLLSGGTYTTFDVPGSLYTFAQGINDAGQIVGEYVLSTGGSRSFLLSGGSYTTVDVPDPSGANGINNAGQLVGTYDGGSNLHTLGYLANPVTTPVQDDQTEEAAFWHSHDGQNLLKSFNGGSHATALADWLAASFPNLYGAAAGPHDLTGKSNAQVAALFQRLWSQDDDGADVQVLATALNVYATTLSLGGTAARRYGFLVTSAGLGDSSFNVGKDGAAFGVANNTSLTVNQLLQAVNQRAARGVLYAGDRHLADLVGDLFERLNEAGD